MTLTYDDNGNLANDGVSQYVYDAWNRLVGVQRVADGDTTTVAAYEFDGRNRRTVKTVTNSGIEDVANDGGNTVTHYYYDNRWRIVETRDGSNQALAQYAWGMGGTGVSPVSYTDELLFIDTNGDPVESSDCDPDAFDAPNDASPDRRYFVHQDRNWNVTALTAYNADPKPFVWAADLQDILPQIMRAHAALDEVPN